MRVKLLTTISFFTCQLSISQSEKLLHGKVFSQNSVLKGVEVINKTAKTSTRTNDLGEFSIQVSVKDSLLFFSKGYFFSRLKITKENIETNNLVVNMILKPEELDEVVITKIKFEKVKYDPEAVAKINIGKQANDLTQFIPGYKDGTIRNPISIVIPLGGSRKKDKNEYVSDFKKFIVPTCPPEFFTKDLKLKPDQKELFIEFCDTDPKSKMLLEYPNILATMDFLYGKNEEFKKLK
ncbi:hypothetical protein [Flavobacterium sp.]|uniref:hypothetical protein n=1 Tax=Flavobacterium sp. TaxID=239 RepID=UPI0032630525